MLDCKNWIHISCVNLEPRDWWKYILICVWKHEIDFKKCVLVWKNLIRRTRLKERNSCLERWNKHLAQAWRRGLPSSNFSTQLVREPTLRIFLIRRISWWRWSMPSKNGRHAFANMSYCLQIEMKISATLNSVGDFGIVFVVNMWIYWAKMSSYV